MNVKNTPMLAGALLAMLLAFTACENKQEEKSESALGEMAMDSSSEMASEPKMEINEADYKSAINWFEIPSKDFDRATKFYNTILAAKLDTMTMNGMKMAMLPMGEKGTGGAIVKHEQMKPSGEGTMVYLNGGEDLAMITARVEAAGGKIIMPKMQVTPEIGYVAIFEDTEGNHVGLHSAK